MIKSLLKYLPPLQELKEQVKNGSNLIENYLNADIILGEEDSISYILKLKSKKQNEKSN